MSEENEIEIQQTPTFKKAVKRLSEKQKDLVDDEIDKIVADPEIGERKKGDLSHLWVHKFKMEGQQILLGYSWNEVGLVITLMNAGPHENFYKEAKKRRAADIKIIR
ncbi:MAG: type II toxin-antitoxin system RelE/ParE family toxin [Gammaproteobacteria bacterium]|nr:type II toxin-antitoxin system RelE/ParE family toxin [Gammaproteobacteria bacterium]MCW8973629.1 type II toxin-antitoxin system RelE/ParE family toxin [Gammaproteobacteria bacterium]MCW8991657.1 type II toxin-antitoxin system RelE/ParE family toxin [Gammaproteobacteria bacterium]